MSDKILQAVSELCTPQTKVAMAAGVGLGKQGRASTTWAESIKDGNTPRGDEVDDRFILLLKSCGEVGMESSKEVIIVSDEDRIDPD